jgi:serine/threonine protein phosphatase PrpC
MSLITPREPSARRERDRTTESRQAVLTTRWAQLELAAASGRSKRHAVNEDSYSPLDRPSPLYVVADGVGGGAMASWASRELVLRLHAALDRGRVDEGSVRDALLDADREVGRTIATHSTGSGAATVALCAGKGALLSRWLIAWVGDCRVYKLGATVDAPAELLTRDDTYGHLGERPPPGGSPDDPARMVGNGAVASPNVDSVHLRYGEMLVLCSDGVHKHVAPHEINRVLRTRTSLASGCRRLLALARLRGSRDDATVLVVHRKASPRPLFAWIAAAVGLVALVLIVLALILR